MIPQNPNTASSIADMIANLILAGMPQISGPTGAVVKPIMPISPMGNLPFSHPFTDPANGGPLSYPVPRSWGPNMGK